MNQGVLYWVTGLSGAGKTTIGNALYYTMKQKCPNTIILDGDILKKIVSESTGYSYEERKSRAKIYSNLCKILVDQGTNVIICTIAMFDEIRDWNRKNIEKYVEVFLDVDMSLLRKRNQRGLYEGNHSDVAGIDVKAELPKNPDIILNNNGDLTAEECAQMILDYHYRKTNLNVDDTEYWNIFYEKNYNKINKPSSFAEYVHKYMKENGTIIDLGCGNGRDSKYFLSKGLNVVGVDTSDKVIEKLSNEYKGENALFVCDNFVTSRNVFQQQYDYCYSRFTLHAINARQEEELLLNVKESLKTGGYFFVEARTIHDDICGLGEEVDKNAYIYNDHYRRFIDVDEFKNKLQSIGGFEIVEMIEDRGFAKLGDSDPTLMRCIVKRVN